MLGSVRTRLERLWAVQQALRTLAYIALAFLLVDHLKTRT